MNTEQRVVTEQKIAMTIRYGKTLYKVIFRFAEKGKATMNDKVLKLIRTDIVKVFFKFPEKYSVKVLDPRAAWSSNAAGCSSRAATA